MSTVDVGRRLGGRDLRLGVRFGTAITLVRVAKWRGEGGSASPAPASLYALSNGSLVGFLPASPCAELVAGFSESKKQKWPRNATLAALDALFSPTASFSALVMPAH